MFHVVLGLDFGVCVFLPSDQHICVICQQL